MPAITRESLLTLEAYAKARHEFRAKVMAHKKNRSVHLGEHVTLLFEDELTMRYQVQEMLRVERIFEEEEIQRELDAYNPLVPGGSNFKATLQIEYEDPTERKRMLAQLHGIARETWVRVARHEKVYAIADEDLERETDEKTASVHFLRFELTPQMKAALKGGAALSVGVEHPQYTAELSELPAATRNALVADLA